MVLNGNGIGNIGGSTSNNNSSHDECSINTNNNSSNHSSNSSIHRATDVRNSRNIVRQTSEKDENNLNGNMKSSLRDDGSIAFTSIDISRSRFSNMTLHPSSTSSPNPTTPSWSISLHVMSCHLTIQLPLFLIFTNTIALTVYHVISKYHTYLTASHHTTPQNTPHTTTSLVV